MADYNAESLAKLRKIDFQPDTLAQKGLGYEKLDQLTFEVLTGGQISRSKKKLELRL